MPPHPKLRDSGNSLLDRLPPDEFAPLEPLLQRVSLNLRDVIHQYEAEVSHVHFPTTALASLLTVLEEDDPVEVSTVGSEGFVGMVAALGIDASPNRVICQMAGSTLRLPLPAFREALARGCVLPRLIHRYIAVSLYGTGRSIACNALHTVEARASKWLLTVHDQAGQDKFPLTQEFWAFMLGVRRQTVTVVAGTLQTAGMIDFRRGVITILDRPMLEESACECYAATRRYYKEIVR